MTKEDFHRQQFRRFMLDPRTPARLDAMLAENARVDAETPIPAPVTTDELFERR